MVSLSLRDVELIMAEPGVGVSYESVWRWRLKFGASFANNLRRRRPRPGDKWHLDGSGANFYVSKGKIDAGPRLYPLYRADSTAFQTVSALLSS